jgi:hypothetical protein
MSSKFRRKLAARQQTKVFVAVTAFSGPACVSTAKSEALASGLDDAFVIATDWIPLFFAVSTADRTSTLSPDCDIAIRMLPVFEGARTQASNSEAGIEFVGIVLDDDIRYWLASAA